MTRLSDIQGHLASMGGLLDIVDAMRSLAGMHVQDAQRALPGVRGFADALAAAVGGALLLVPQPVAEAGRDQGRRALVLYTSEHGFVGGFNETLRAAAAAILQPDDSLFVLGSRGSALVQERGCKVAWTRPMATRLAGAADAVNQLTDALYTRVARGDIGRMSVMFARYRQGAAPTVECRVLLPLDTASLATAASRQVPLHNLAPRPLMESLMQEYVFALLTEAAVESLASENAARFAAMSSAHDNVGRKLAQLQASERQARQSEITSELLDLVTGAEAMRANSVRPGQGL